MFTLQRDGAQVLERDLSLSFKTDRRLGDLHTFQRAGKIINNCKFSEVNALGKGSSEAYSWGGGGRNLSEV